MTDQLGLFAASPRQDVPASLPSASDVVAAGWTPLQYFERRYPRARNLRGQILREVVRDGTAAPCARAAWDSWYREHWGAPIEVHLNAKEPLNPCPKQAKDTTVFGMSNDRLDEECA